MSAHRDFRDYELDGLADEQGWDLETRDLAQYLRSTPHRYAHVQPNPQFRDSLRRALMREAWERATAPPPPWYRRLLAPQPMAIAGAAVGALLLISVGFMATLGPRQQDEINVAVNSPQNNAELAPTVQPIELRFSQPMKTDTVQLDVEPTTLVTTHWDAQHRVLEITPVNDLSANTRYQVTVTSATTASGQQASKIKPVVFNTGPTPAPTPTIGPRPTPTPSPILSPHDLGPIAPGSRAHWSIDGSSLIVIGPTGSLEQIPVAGGPALKLADGVSLDAVAPDGGSVAWFGNGQVTWKTSVINNVQPIALGFRSTTLLMAGANDVETADLKRVAAFKEAADAAEFSAAGDVVAYHGASGLHLVDLASGVDTLIGPATALGAWAPDGRHYAYLTDTSVMAVNVDDDSTVKAADLAGVNGVAWSRGNQLLLTTTAGSLSLLTFNGSTPSAPQKLSTSTDGTFAQPDWATNSSGQFSFHRGTDIWIARIQNAVPGTPITPVTPGVNQDELVNTFMTDRKNLLGDQALAFLDANGRQAFSRLTLIYQDGSLARYYVLLSQPGREIVRLVLVHGSAQTAIDETLIIQPDASNHLFIHSVTETPRVSFGTGPEVIGTSVSSTQVQVRFDSDLDPNSAIQPGAVAIQGVVTQAAYDSRSKTVTLTVTGGLTPGVTYDLVIGSNLEDATRQRNAVPYDLPFTGPSPSATPTPSPGG
jgi:hypothetical protein